MLVFAAPASAAPSFGFNDNSVQPKQSTATQAADLASKAGATVYRTNMDWRWMHAKANEPVRWSQHDEIYAAMRAKGIRPVWIVMNAPSWALDGACDQWTTECRMPPTAAHYDAWRNFVAQVAHRYPESAAIEVWNEPNLIYFWKPFPDAAGYTDILREAYRGVNEGAEAVPNTTLDAVPATPAVPVITGGFSNNHVTGSIGISLVDFLESVYRNGGKPYFDGIGFHPYPGGLDTHSSSQMIRDINDVRRIRDANGDSAKKLWLTEAGLTTTGTPAYTEEAQTYLNVRMWRAVKPMTDVAALMVHTLVEPNFDGAAGKGYGIVRQDLTPKPAFCGIAAELKTGYSCPISFRTATTLIKENDNAQQILSTAYAAAQDWYATRGTYVGLTHAWLAKRSRSLSSTPLAEPAAPGTGANPAQIAITIVPDGQEIQLRNASRGVFAYAIWGRRGAGAFLRYGKDPSSTWGAAGSVAGSGGAASWTALG